MWRLRYQKKCARLSFVLVSFVSLSIGAPELAKAQEINATDGAKLVAEVTGLRKAVESVVTLLDELSKSQRLDILLKRIELQERRLAPIEAELRAARRELVSQQERLMRLYANLDDLDKRFLVESQEDPNDQEKEDDYTAMRQELEATINAKSTAFAAFEARIRALEDDLKEGRAEMRGLDNDLQQVLASKKTRP